MAHITMVLEALDDWHSANHLPDITEGHVAAHQADGSSLEKSVIQDDLSAESARIIDGSLERISCQHTRHGNGAGYTAPRTFAEDNNLIIL